MTETALHRSPGHVETGAAPVIAIAAATCGVMTTSLLYRDYNQGPVWRVTLVIAAVVAVVSWIVTKKVRRILARNEAAASARAALVFGLLTIVSVVGFWVAVPPIFAAAATVTAGASRRQSAAMPWQTVLGVVLAGLGVTVGLVFALVASR